ncbi:MAG TPA: PBP1A family penicillin-binding protein [Pseudolabrys sp.]|nr:PBP1A family penicillin-binding protein [Pseudolabrys sp.]
MAGRGHSGGRREPVFDDAPEVRVTPGDGGNRPRKTSPKKKKARSKARGGKRSLIGRVAYWSLIACIWVCIGLTAVVGYVGAHLPPIQSLEIPKRPPTIRMLDSAGNEFARRGDMAGEVLALKDMPPHVPRAFIAIEDRRFYDHYGIDPYGIARAVVANAMHRGVAQGGSTLTQQLAKNLFLTQERTLTRKLQEAMLALWLERKFSKAQILELYLNRVYFGAGAYGIEQASQRYFSKPAKQLSIGEAALLAGLVKSPSRLAPTRDYNAAERRSRIVLASMSELGFITPASEKLAIAKPPRIVAQVNSGSSNYVADWIMDAVNDTLGHIEEDIVVQTTIDSAAQASAEKALADEFAKATKVGATQAALVSMTPNGAVRALIGGRNYADSQFNRAVAAKRQPGSAFKPFVYLTALERGLTPDTVRVDGPIKIKGWAPENYSHEYFGPVTLTRALALSLNTVSVRLTMEVTPMAVIRTAHRLGIASKLEPNASISLGTSEVSPLELTGAYAVFANGGNAVTPYVIERISTVEGKVLYFRNQQPLGRIVDAGTVGMMNQMMQETLTIGTAHKADLGGVPAAGKTGTSQDFRDAWFVGYTAHLVTSVWLGNDDNTPMKKVTGGGLPVEIWSRYMRDVHRGVPVAGLPSVPSRGFFDNLFGGNQPAPAQQRPEPPASVPMASNEPRQTTGAGLDGWLLDNLFGRR